MSFSAGGANVGGVQAIEQGTLTTPTISTFSVVDNTGVTADFTVPAGKIWVYKAANSFKSTGTYTVGNCNLTIFPSGTGGEGTTIYSASGGITHLTTSLITLPAGAVIRLTAGISSHSVTGNFISKIVVQQSNS